MSDTDRSETPYRCFEAKCPREFASLDDMVAVPGMADLDPRHFCEECADRLRRGPPMTDGGTERKEVSVLESMEITAEAQEEYDECPECGEEYIDLDTTLTGTLVFIHEENPLKDCTLDTGTDI